MKGKQLLLHIDDFIIYYFGCSITNIIHSLHQEHYIGWFELFSYIFFFGEFIYQLEKKLLGLFLGIGIGKVGMKFAGSEQIIIQNFAVVL